MTNPDATSLESNQLLARAGVLPVLVRIPAILAKRVTPAAPQPVLTDVATLEISTPAQTPQPSPMPAPLHQSAPISEARTFAPLQPQVQKVVTQHVEQAVFTKATPRSEQNRTCSLPNSRPSAGSRILRLHGLIMPNSGLIMAAAAVLAALTLGWLNASPGTPKSGFHQPFQQVGAGWKRAEQPSPSPAPSAVPHQPIPQQPTPDQYVEAQTREQNAASSGRTTIAKLETLPKATYATDNGTFEYPTTGHGSRYPIAAGQGGATNHSTEVANRAAETTR